VIAITIVYRYLVTMETILPALITLDLSEQFENPIGIGISSIGNVYVVDGKNSDVYVYAPTK